MPPDHRFFLHIYVDLLHTYKCTLNQSGVSFFQVWCKSPVLYDFDLQIVSRHSGMQFRFVAFTQTSAPALMTSLFCRPSCSTKLWKKLSISRSSCQSHTRTHTFDLLFDPMISWLLQLFEVDVWLWNVLRLKWSVYIQGHHRNISKQTCLSLIRNFIFNWLGLVFFALFSCSIQSCRLTSFCGPVAYNNILWFRMYFHLLGNVFVNAGLVCFRWRFQAETKAHKTR